MLSTLIVVVASSNILHTGTGKSDTALRRLIASQRCSWMDPAQLLAAQSDLYPVMVTFAW
jgi:hypothetical protein